MDGEEAEPEREPLHFTIETEDVPPELADVMLHIKQLAEGMLYHWRYFPIVLPTSITGNTRGDEEDTDSEDDENNRAAIRFKDLFISPTFDELEEVAMDGKRHAKKLSDKQLQSIRQMGEFEVDSIHFPGQVHRWRLTQLLQKGTHRSQESLLNDAALSLRLLIITARNRFYSHFFSVSESFKAILKGLWQLLDILIGMPSTTPGELHQKIQQEHSRFLVAELDVLAVCRRDYTGFCDFIKEKCQLLESERNKTTDFKPPPPPYKFQTPKGSEIDLILFNRDTIQKSSLLLRNILERESKGWYVKYKDRIIADLKGENLSHEQLTERVNKNVLEEYLRKVYDAILNSEDIDNLHPGLGKLLVQQAQSCLIMSKALENVKIKYRKHSREHRQLLVESSPVKSCIKAWTNERIAEFMNEFISQNQWCPHEEAIEQCRSLHLDQAMYFLQRDLIFMRDREAVLKKELSKVRNPTRVFTFSYRIWMPGNWIVRRHLYGESEVIPTMIVDTPTSSTSQGARPDEPKFTMQRYQHRKCSTRYPFWRWINYAHRTWSWSWNAMFWLGLVIPWCSPVSFRALVFLDAFMPDLELNQVNGTLCPKKSSLTHTLVSRLRALWQHVRHSRAKFEAEPDTTFLGKSFTRHINRVWNYFFKGALGSVGLVVVFIPVCLVASTLSLAAAVTTPVWMPVVSLVAHLVAVTIYDFNHPNDGNAVMYLFEAIIFRLLIQGLLQPIGALVSAVIVLPIASLGVILFGVLRRGSRAVWDALMFHAVIKNRGRVPASEGFIARRTAGPGMASNYFYQVRPEQALAAVEAEMELHELQAWTDSVLYVAEQPKRDYGIFVEQLFHPFSATLSEMGVYKKLLKETQKLVVDVRRAADARRQKLHTGLTPDIQGRIKLSGRELKVVVAQTAKMVEGFYPDHILRRLTKSEEDFWEDKELEEGDWEGLATHLLTEIFSSSFMMPLEDTDTCFKLEVHHLNLSRYIEMLKSAEFRDDLDVVSTVHTPKGDIDVDAPYLEVFVFNPMKQDVKYAEYLGPRRRKKKWPWKKEGTDLVEIERMGVPLPIPHPGVISVLVYNRENDQDQIDTEDPVCQRILRAAEGIPYSHMRAPYSMELSEGEGEVSTPDYTTNSEPEGGAAVHLAESERAFSEGEENATTPASIPDPSASGAAAAAAADAAEAEKPESIVIEGMSDGQPRVMYRENEADTSCVLNMEEDEEKKSFHSSQCTDSSYDDKDYESFSRIVESKSGTV